MTKLTPLKLARLHTGKSQWDVAKETGIPQTVVSLYERELKEPKPEHKTTLARLYGKKVEQLWKYPSDPRIEDGSSRTPGTEPRENR